MKLAYRINVNGGIVQVRPDPSKPYSSFNEPSFIPFLLKVRAIKVIKLRDGTRMIVRPDSFKKNTEEKYNEKATKLLHEQSWQKTAVIYGPVIVMNPEDWQ